MMVWLFGALNAFLDLHPKLLDPDDEFLTAIMVPLMDEKDDLDDEEVGKLPIGLQYWDKPRESVDMFRSTVIETLYQVRLWFFFGLTTPFFSYVPRNSAVQRSAPKASTRS